MLAARRYLSAGLCVVIAASVLSAQDGSTPRGSIQLVSAPAAFTTLEVGQRVDLRIDAAYRDVPADARLYVIFTPLRGEAMLFGPEESLTTKGSSLSNCANFAAVDRSPFALSSTNFPLTVTIDVEQILDVLMKGMPPEQLKDEKDKRKGEKLRLTFAFAAALPDGAGTAKGTVPFTVPDLGYHYDGILITPYFFRFASDGSQCGTYDSKRMQGLKFRVNPNRPAPVPKPEKPKIVAPTGEATITTYQATPLRIGAPAEVQVKARYSGLGVGSQVYVVLQAVKGDTVIGTRGLSASAGQMSFTTCEDIGFTGGFFGIPAASKPLYIASLPFFGQIEASMLGSVERGGTGELEGTVRFTPPPFNQFYDGVRMIPIIFQWNDDGKRCGAFDTAKMRPVTVKLMGR